MSDRPESGRSRGGIVLLHEIWGLSAPIVDLMARLSRLGYTVAAPKLYHRIGSPVVEYDSLSEARRYHNTLTVDHLTYDIESARDWCRGQGSASVAVIGFSMGGTLALWAASTLDVNAAVTFYGGGLSSSRWPGVLSGIDAARSLKVPWLGIYGGRDRSTPAKDLDRLRAALPDDVPSKVVVYPTARHGFALDSDSPHHSPADTARAFDLMGDFLDDHLR